MPRQRTLNRTHDFVYFISREIAGVPHRLCQDLRWHQHTPIGTEPNCLKIYTVYGVAVKRAQRLHGQLVPVPKGADIFASGEVGVPGRGFVKHEQLIQDFARIVQPSRHVLLRDTPLTEELLPRAGLQRTLLSTAQPCWLLRLADADSSMLIRFLAEAGGPGAGFYAAVDVPDCPRVIPRTFRTWGELEDFINCLLNPEQRAAYWAAANS